MNAQGRSAFRALWRAQRSVFLKDEHAQQIARARIRKAFREAKPDKVDKQVQVAFDAARYLRESVVQAPFEAEKGRYRAVLSEKHAEPQQ